MTSLPLFLLSVALSGTPDAQAPAPPPQPAPQTTTPATPARRAAAQRPRASTATSTLEVTVADPGGNPYIPSFGGAIDQVFVFFGNALSLDQLRAVQGKNSYP